MSGDRRVVAHGADLLNYHLSTFNSAGQMIWHQDEAPDEKFTLQGEKAKLLEGVKDKLVSQDGPSSLNASRHEIQRTIGEYPVQPLKRCLPCSGGVPTADPSNLTITGFPFRNRFLR